MATPSTWHWLTTGQNATAVQAVAAVIASGAAAGAAWFAAGAYKASRKQVSLLREQVQIARSHFLEERKRFEEERRNSERLAKAAYDRTAAEEEAIRPRFGMGVAHNSLVAHVRFPNSGGSAAFDVVAYNHATKQELGRAALIPPYQSLDFDVAPDVVKSIGIELRYRSSFGTLWTFVYALDRPDEFISASRLY